MGLGWYYHTQQHDLPTAIMWYLAAIPHSLHVSHTTRPHHTPRKPLPPCNTVFTTTRWCFMQSSVQQTTYHTTRKSENRLLPVIQYPLLPILITGLWPDGFNPVVVTGLRNYMYQYYQTIRPHAFYAILGSSGWRSNRCSNHSLLWHQKPRRYNPVSITMSLLAVQSQATDMGDLILLFLMEDKH